MTSWWSKSKNFHVFLIACFFWVVRYFPSLFGVGCCLFFGVGHSEGMILQQSGSITWIYPPTHTLPETNSFAPENGWLEHRGNGLLSGANCLFLTVVMKVKRDPLMVTGILVNLFRNGICLNLFEPPTKTGWWLQSFLIIISIRLSDEVLYLCRPLAER